MNFNPLNFLNNFAARQMMNTQAASTQAAKESSVNPQGANFASPRPVPNVAQYGAMPFYVLSDAPYMGEGDKMKMLREFLYLPSELEEFLNMEILAKTGTAEKAGKNINSQTSVQIAEILKLLNENTSLATKKIMDLMTSFARDGNLSSQKELKDILNIITTLNANFSADTNQILKTFVIYYLPWLPLNTKTGENLNFEIDFEKKKEAGRGEDSETQSATITITTKTWGAIRAILEYTSSSLTTLIYANNSFPLSEFEKLFAEKTKKLNMTNTILKEDIKQSPEKTEKTSVQISTEDNINSYLLFAIYSLIRLIFEMDKANSTN
ncbi:hypothetical protein IKA15_01825 [bacterium]|nr:hypothetical protein [bacterium]